MTGDDQSLLVRKGHRGQPAQCHFNKTDEHKVKSGLERRCQEQRSRQGRPNTSIIDAPKGKKNSEEHEKWWKF